MRHPLFPRAVLFLFVLVLSTSCQDDDPGPVTPPATGDPPETLARAERLYEDAEGVHYRGLLVNAGPEVVAVEWRLQAVPEVQSGAVLMRDAAWTRVEDTEFEFVIPPASGGSDRWVLFVRAVSEEGLADESPMQISFGPDSVAPEVRLVEPRPPTRNSCVSAGPVIDISWSVTDPDSTEGPIVVRHVAMEVGSAENPCLTKLEYDRVQPIAHLDPDDARWSEWTLYDGEAETFDPSRSTRLDAFELGHTYLIAVQARDATGATTSSFEWYRNVLHIRVDEAKSPVLLLVSNLLNGDPFEAQGEVIPVATHDRLPVKFAWHADASWYAGRIVGYRWGWDLEDPDAPDDPGWSGPWSLGTTIVERTLEPGPHNFVVACRDNSGMVSKVVFQIDCVAVPDPSERHDVLLVDDWRDVGSDAWARERVWDAQWEQWLSAIVPDFDPVRDVIDAQREPEALTLARLLQYRSIVWFGNASNQSYLASVYAPVPGELRSNHLELVQQGAANVLLVGPGVSLSAMDSVPSIDWEFPIWFVDGANPCWLNPPFPGLPQEPIPGFPQGTSHRWLSTGFCLRTLSVVRPPITDIWREPEGRRIRTKQCDALIRAPVAPEFEAEFGAGQIPELRPTEARLELYPGYSFDSEEFYDHNASGCDAEVVPRDCSVPMFVHNSRLSEGLAHPEVDCGIKLYSLDGAAVAMLSRAYSHTKPVPGTYDFLWGFNPMGFVAEDVQAALVWVVEEGWSIR